MADEGEKKKVVVVSRLQNAVALRIDEMVDGADHGQIGYAGVAPGERMARQKGSAVELRPGRNEIDADFWREWREQNKHGEMINLFDAEIEKTEPE